MQFYPCLGTSPVSEIYVFGKRKGRLVAPLGGGKLNVFLRQSLKHVRAFVGLSQCIVKTGKTACGNDCGGKNVKFSNFLGIVWHVGCVINQ
jgi:hypothetical protein